MHSPASHFLQTSLGAFSQANRRRSRPLALAGVGTEGLTARAGVRDRWTGAGTEGSTAGAGVRNRWSQSKATVFSISTAGAVTTGLMAGAGTGFIMVVSQNRPSESASRANKEDGLCGVRSSWFPHEV